MTTVAATAPRRAGAVLGDLLGRSRAAEAVLVLAGAVWVAALGQVAVPLGFTPVPLSLGTFAVLTAGSALGARRGAAAMALFVAAGAAGAPVFAGQQGGLGLPTLGYAVGYIAAAALAGRAAERGWDRSPGATLGVMAAGSALIYLVGVPYLVAAANLGWAAGLSQGVAPFLLGDLIKAALAAAVLPAVWRLAGRAARLAEAANLGQHGH
ncbi:MAG: biotin transporter BioY [Bifidobacteriaceae bacterium]|jgi:biotin transport system substrate-specific component|nr:biotin transporter BioY [Bifidobacteriaceae bacterium]